MKAEWIKWAALVSVTALLISGNQVMAQSDDGMPPPPSGSGARDGGAVSTPPASIFVGDVSVIEGNTGWVNAIFTVTLSPASAGTVTVGYAMAAGTATAGSDFLARAGTLTFLPGVTTRTIVVPVVGDRLVEGDEIFSVDLANATGGAAIADAQGVCTIRSDDCSIRLSSSVITASETDNSVTITATRTGGGSGVAGVRYATANGTAIAGRDYTATSGTLSWADGETGEKSFVVPITDDSLDESNEWLAVALSSPTGGAVLGQPARGIAAIVDDDPAPTVEFSTAESSGAESTTPAVLNVTLSAASAKTVTVKYATANGTATAGSDYVATAGTLTFAPGVTNRMIAVPIVNNAIAEPDELFSVTLKTPVNATLGATTTHTHTISDEDVSGAIRLSAASYAVGERGPAVTITAMRVGGSGGAVGVSYATADGTATAGVDYLAATGSLSWASGDRANKTFTVPIVNDAFDEANETFTVMLSAPTGGAILGAPASRTVTIVDNDPTPTVQFGLSTSSAPESATPLVLTVSLSAASNRGVTVNYSTVNGTAAAGSDYTAASGTLTFALGETSQTIAVPILDDTAVEANETFAVRLSSAVNANLGSRYRHFHTIANDDFHGTIRLNSAAFSAREAEPKVTITATRTGGSSGAVGVSFATSNGTAAAGADYAATSGRLSWPDGDTADKTFDVSLLNDLFDEQSEQFIVRLLSPAGGAALGAPFVGSVTIVDDDPTPTVQFDRATASGVASTTQAALGVTLSAASGQTVTVRYATTNGTASAGSDYLAAAGILTFTPGQTIKTITVPIMNNTPVEPDESFTVTLSSPVNAILGAAATQTYTIKGAAPTAGPTPCTVQADCAAAGACPPDATKGCACAPTPQGNRCVPQCTTTDDCRQSPGKTMVCGPAGLCVQDDGGGGGDPGMTIDDTISDQAQSMTIAFDGLAFVTGTFCAQTFYPPGKVADFFGFQYLRDNDPSGMGHNTDFTTLTADPILVLLNDAQLKTLSDLGATEGALNEAYGYARFPLAKAFRRLNDGDLPEGKSGLSRDAVRAYSAYLFGIDGEMSYLRAQAYASVLGSMDAGQQAALAGMKGKGSLEWPQPTQAEVDAVLSRYPGQMIRTYAGEMLAWYLGNVDADVYFCPERQGTYFGSFFMKDVKAMHNPGYTIDSNMTADMGDAFLGALDTAQKAQITGLVSEQKADLLAIVAKRDEISRTLRNFLSTGGTVDEAAVINLARQYGELDGEISYLYATNFSAVGTTLTAAQQAALMALRKTATAEDGGSPDYDSMCGDGYLYSTPLQAPPEVMNTDFMFGVCGAEDSPCSTDWDCCSFSCGGNVCQSVFALASTAFVDGGTLPGAYTCDGTGGMNSPSPPLAWTGAPEGTVEYALTISTVALDGTKWNWVVFHIPGDVTSLAEGTAVGTAGVSTDGPELRYYPPCSSGPGEKTYTFTLHALSGVPQFSVPESQVTGAILASAISPLIIQSRQVNVTYTRTGL